MLIGFFISALVLTGPASAQLPPEISAGKTCGGKPVGSSCWMALTNQSECYIWNPYLQKDETVTWSGKCSGNLAHGEGTLTWAVTDGDSLKILGTDTGHLQKGNFHGQWVHRPSKWTVEEGPYVDGKKHGQWIWRHLDGAVEERFYVNGKPHGKWVLRERDGSVREISFVDGKAHGKSVFHFSEGYKSRREYINGKREGTWLVYNRILEVCLSIRYHQDQEVERKKVNKEMCR